jgi:GNAT superfamily N-acetyltransferase
MVVVDHALVARVESCAARDAAALAGALAAIEPGSGACSVARAGGRVVHMGRGMYVNRAIGLGITTDATADDVAFVVDFYNQRGLDAEIEFCPYANDELRAAATTMGFGLAWSRNVYVRDAREPDDAPAALQFVAVADDATYADWLATCRATFGGDPEIVRRFLAARHRTPGEHAWVAYVDGAAVAACSISVGDGVAEFGGMGTLPPARGRGVQQACIAYRIAAARDAGCDLLVSSATPGGASARNLERAGFECAYTSSGLVRPRQAG